MRRYFCILLLCLVATSNASRVALFVLGDSTSHRLHVDGLAPFCRGTTDPLAQRWFEMNGCKNNEDPHTCMYDDKPYVCAPEAPFSRIGYTIHWGIQPPPYHNTWTGHRSLGDSENSITNIMDAVAEFQKRSIEEGGIFILLSNIWNVKRYMDHFFDDDAPGKFKSNFARHAERVVDSLLALMRHNDTLVLTTYHMPMSTYAAYSMMLNDAFRAIAFNKGIKLFDEAALFDDRCVREYLSDEIHQTPEASKTIAQAIIKSLM